MQEISKAKVKEISALLRKKARQEAGLFIAEGWKMLREALASGMLLQCVVCRRDDAGRLKQLPLPDHVPVYSASEKDFERLTDQPQPEGVISVIRTPASIAAPDTAMLAGPVFLLDTIRDPGNLGTILRTADWFGFSGVICSPGTAEVFNPRTLRASMGSAFRVPVCQLDTFGDFLQEHASHIWAAALGGTPLNEVRLRDRPMLLIGSESHGISPEWLSIPGIHRVTIPAFGKAESLNASVAASVLAWELRR